MKNPTRKLFSLLALVLLLCSLLALPAAALDVEPEVPAEIWIIHAA